MVKESGCFTGENPNQTSPEGSRQGTMGGARQSLKGEDMVLLGSRDLQQSFFQRQWGVVAVPYNCIFWVWHPRVGALGAIWPWGARCPCECAHAFITSWVGKCQKHLLLLPELRSDGSACCLGTHNHSLGDFAPDSALSAFTLLPWKWCHMTLFLPRHYSIPLCHWSCIFQIFQFQITCSKEIQGEKILVYRKRCTSNSMTDLQIKTCGCNWTEFHGL